MAPLPEPDGGLKLAMVAALLVVANMLRAIDVIDPLPTAIAGLRATGAAVGAGVGPLAPVILYAVLLPAGS